MIAEYEDKFRQRVLDLILNIQRGEYGMSITAKDQPDLADICGFYKTGNGNFWVALQGEEVVGTIALKDIGNAQNALRKMFVAQHWRCRDKGIAASLLWTALDWAKDRGVTEIFLGTTPHFLAAHKFYERKGFHEIPKESLPKSFPIMKVDTKFYSSKLSLIISDIRH
ncbi:MAG: GNAT family N-acetyltransferase [Alphaproteobacteria bacterium]|nr:GNAT family N-acetyltransferase [Alphaproteobacteria bacterium]MBP7760042.1 GNAT family N-acetyltransferase [Alphaproteobacteria bacterium]MBP7763404.1 GNAT family N-acetyltransferase [Alphaproteobacteria bacterium]MBP7905749.1 GNAT family N-acetyltransferase [Alphaproteobacteria bacterium]